MPCPVCHGESRDSAKFYDECGASLPVRCAACGAENRPSAKFCNECRTVKGKVKVPPEFFEPLPEEILRAFEGQRG